MCPKHRELWETRDPRKRPDHPTLLAMLAGDWRASISFTSFQDPGSGTPHHARPFELQDVIYRSSKSHQTRRPRDSTHSPRSSPSPPTPVYGASAPAVCSPVSPAGADLVPTMNLLGTPEMPLRCSTAVFLDTGEGHLILYYTNNSCVGLSSIRIILILKPSVNHKSVTHQGKQRQDTTNVSLTKAELVL